MFYIDQFDIKLNRKGTKKTTMFTLITTHSYSGVKRFLHPTELYAARVPQRSPVCFRRMLVSCFASSSRPWPPC